MQEAYASENNNVGTWAAIGYKGPGSQNADGSGSVTSTFTYSNTAAGNWIASNGVALNDCQANNTWTVTSSYESGDVTTTAVSSNQNDCVTPLTPNFCKIATSGNCTASASATP